MSCVERFVMGNVQGHEHSCRWLTGFVHRYRPLVNDLQLQRDKRLARRSNLAHTLNDRRLEAMTVTASRDIASDGVNARGIKVSARATPSPPVVQRS